MKQAAEGKGAPGPVVRLGNGVQVLAEEMAGASSVAVGAWVRQGAALEPPELLGASHLLEHMVFKGTRTRSAREIAFSMERVGGSLDAYTSREHTSYQARSLGCHLPLAMEVLSDLIRNPALREEDLEKEKAVVAEEIAAVEDAPDDVVFDLHGERLWRGHPYGSPILGTRASVAALARESLERLRAAAYTGANIVVAAAGDLDRREFVDLAEEWFGDIEAGARLPDPPAPATAEAGVDRIERDSAQTHVVTGWTTPGRAHPGRYARSLLSEALGGGMSSRLFQRVREELALAYSVYSFHSLYSRGGVFGVYAGTRPGAEEAVLAAVAEEYDRSLGTGLSDAELTEIKEQVKGRMLLALEGPGARVQRLAGLALADEPIVSLEELAARVDQVSAEEMAREAEAVLHPDRQYALCLGPPGSVATAGSGAETAGRPHAHSGASDGQSRPSDAHSCPSDAQSRPNDP